ncbi:hypothetical protein pEaSNUABM50_00124 [Erwinia phage pEa_SNUABM_50]|uniref:Uncharacterized protein n=4 Tax=Eneladusvirus BF TaxID=2560751 RepID=A0A7L8ZNJ6_9CAUD|nr:hypothetical protein FDH34_gp126 [Serratia phage BF]QOI71064.1 hypothetical protein pEaSNUABM12_00126 [Erwinia phage pEa_SNUABM_12]QOI71609.1 hypothetical protein pEaSNUABM47_00125 [Erwinia phage pEa_SNUABM_47]QOI72148.1 hypothetical protein pEaSNUABM50_00124 [Erwinia phage pEa_SNUABM_50]QXO11273.1 hypothetical protein pEaSNUABM19_00127 [Erwinia phage pEa_SNUABM_19]QXO11821.1 hypothetical protein pEaSNUABM44_00125 [Erwinia phage pEa_SNUABM_44]QXO12373.1 hypothetical protein pEaSNUABM49_001
MSQTYTAVLYRYNHSDYCRGCLMGSSDSDLKIYTGTSQQDIIDMILPVLVESKLNSDKHYEYAEYEPIIFFNGITDGYSGYEENSAFVNTFAQQYLNEVRGMLDTQLTQAITEARKEVKIQEERKARENAELNRQRAEEEERAEFERLKSKFGE